MENLTEREKELLIAGIRIQLDECEKKQFNYDSGNREYANMKKNELYTIWKKLEQL